MKKTINGVPVLTETVKMLVWDYDEKNATEAYVVGYIEGKAYPYITEIASWKNAKPMPKPWEIKELTMAEAMKDLEKIHGKDIKIVK